MTQRRRCEVRLCRTRRYFRDSTARLVIQVKKRFESRTMLLTVVLGLSVESARSKKKKGNTKTETVMIEVKFENTE